MRITTLVPGLVLLALVTAADGDQVAERKALAARMSAETRPYLPIRLDTHTVLSDVAAQGGSVTYVYAISKIASPWVGINRDALRQNSCTHELLKDILRLGGAVVYRYEFEDGRDAQEVRTTLADCERPK